MRSVSSTSAPQTLSAEAASVLKHSLTLARRRGHAQVTPLHVAGTLLTSRTSLLRTACLKSQQQPQNHHPLQCRALELCFNVALNRLPATPGPLLHAQPSLSNALVAALKRAQAHQRRGCVEQQNHHHQQQQVMGVKVELDQLVLSILDDPSVSRVMREAGFSSTKVKECLEECSSYGVVSSVFYNASGGIYSTPSSPPSEVGAGGSRAVVYNNSNPYRSYGYSKEGFNISSSSSSLLWDYASNNSSAFVFPHEKRVFSGADYYSCIKDDDVKLVFDVFLRKKRRNAVVIGDFVSLAEKLVSEVMKKVERDDDDGAVHVDLRSAHVIKFQFSSVPLTFMKREEVEMNVGDLKRKIDAFASEGRSVLVYTGDLKWTVDDRKSSSGDDDANLIAAYNPVDHLVAEMGKLISFYNSCNAKVWLMATASFQTYMKCQMKHHPPLDVLWNLQAVSFPVAGGLLGLSLDAANNNTTMSSCQALDKKPCNVVKEEEDNSCFLSCCQECASNYEKEASFKSDINGSSHQLPSWLKIHSNTEPSGKDDLAQLRSKYNNLCRNLHQGRLNNSPCIILGGERSCSSSPHWPKKNDILFPDSEKFNRSPVSVPRFRRQQSCHIEFSFSNNEISKKKPRSLEPNLDSLKATDDKGVKITLALGRSTSTYSDASSLCRTLQENVPWQREKVPLIAEALVDRKNFGGNKLLLFEGDDFVGMRRIATGIASSVFGSSDFLFLMNMRENTNTTAKESLENIENAFKSHEKLVFLIEDAEYADPEFLRYIIDEKLRTSTWGEEKDAVFVLTANSGHESESVIEMKLLIEESKPGLGIPANNKRKAEWDFSSSSKSPRNNEAAEEVSSEIKRQSSLDLNALADETERKPQEATRALLETINHRFTLSTNPDGEEQAKEMFSLMLRGAFRRTPCAAAAFRVDERVIEEILNGSGFYLNGLFEEWAGDVLETSLRMVSDGVIGKEKVISIRLCLGGKREKWGKGKGYRNTSLPEKIQVSFNG